MFVVTGGAGFIGSTLVRALNDRGITDIWVVDEPSDGEQRRDFIHVDDVVATNLHFALGPRPRPPRQGIFNLGTGQARSFNDVVRGLIDAFGERLEAREERIEYIPFPDSLRGKYQSFTQADLTRLRQAGYRESFISLEDGIRRLVTALATDTQAHSLGEHERGGQCNE